MRPCSPLNEVGVKFIYISYYRLLIYRQVKNNLMQFYDKKHVDYFEVTSIQRIFAIRQTVFDCKNEKAQGVFVISF